MGKKVMIYCDGGARGNPGPAASACVIVVDEKMVYSESKHLGIATNNIAEYSAVLIAYGWLSNKKDLLSDKEIIFILDSELVVRQLLGKYKVKKDHLKILYDRIKDYEKEFKDISYTHVLRHKNEMADRLVNERLDKGQ